jgi:multicomponent K+:H+ antiporter subunit A
MLGAALTGVGAWLASRPFLASVATDIHLPLLGSLHLSTVLVFDLGVYLLVVGAVMLILISLAHQSLRSQRKAAPVPEAAEAEREAVV